MNLFCDSTADFSDCRRYRYSLWRRWSDGPLIAYVMLNPSTADEFENDPTIERCQRRATKLGYGALAVANIFAYRSTDPDALRDLTPAEAIGERNDAAILAVCAEAKTVVLAWGKDGNLYGRGAEVRALLKQLDVVCLGTNIDGTPKHPLYVAYTQPFVRMGLGR